MAENEYEEPPKGLKDFIFDVMEEDEEEPKEKPFFEKALENPELIKQGVNSLKSIINTYRQNKKRSR